MLPSSGLKLKFSFLAIIFCGIFGLAKNSQAATYYVTATGAGAKTGESIANAFDPAAHDAATFQPDDLIYLSDVNGIFKTGLVPPSSGTVGHSIIYKAVPGETPTIDTSLVLPSTGWTNLGGGIYSHGSLLNNNPPTIVYFNDVPQICATSLETLGTDGSWFSDYVGGARIVVKVPEGETIGSLNVSYTNHIPYAGYRAFDILDKQHITIDGTSGKTGNTGLTLTHNDFTIYLHETEGTGLPPNGIEIKNVAFKTTVSAIYGGIYTDTTGISIHDNYFYRTERCVGLYTAGTAKNYLSTHVYNNIAYDTGLMTDTDYWNYSDSNGLRDLEIFGFQNLSDSDVYDNYASGGKAVGVFLYIKANANSSNNNILRNMFVDTKLNGFYSHGETGAVLSGNVIAYNIFKNTGTEVNVLGPVRFYMITQPPSNNVFSNNTIDGGITGISLAGAYAGYLTAQNNIMQNLTTGYWSWSDLPSTISTNNIYFNSPDNFGNGGTTLANRKLIYGLDLNSVIANPQFVSSTDCHLLNISPAINAGTDVGLTTDFDGNSILGNPDIGAYEYQGDIVAPMAPGGLAVN